jgi:addiction module RelB/DinJ family antitoxin
MNSTLTVRIDDNIKKEFTNIVKALGLDPPTVVRMLIHQTVSQKAVPLSLALPNKESDDTMQFLDNVRTDWGEW